MVRIFEDGSTMFFDSRRRGLCCAVCHAQYAPDVLLVCWLGLRICCRKCGRPFNGLSRSMFSKDYGAYVPLEDDYDEWH